MKIDICDRCGIRSLILRFPCGEKVHPAHISHNDLAEAYDVLYEENERLRALIKTKGLGKENEE